MADRLLTSAEKLVAILTGVEGSLLLGMRLLLWRVERREAQHLGLSLISGPAIRDPRSRTHFAEATGPEVWESFR